MEESGMQSGTKPYRGWLVVAGCLVVAMAVVGITTFAFGLFVVPASRELGVSRGEANLVLILISAGSALAAPITGRLVDRFPAQRVIAAGALSVGAGLLVISMTSSPLIIAACAAFFLGFGIMGSGALVATTVAARWFKRRLGRVLGLISTSGTAGGIFIPPLAAPLIVQFGWRTALAVLAAGFCLIALAAARWLIVAAPAPGEMRAGGEETATGPNASASGASGRTWTYRQLFAERTFWLIAIATSTLLANFFAVAVTLAPSLVDRGSTVQAAAFMVSALTGGAVASKLLIGVLSERMAARPLLMFSAIAHLALLAVLLTEPSYPVMLGCVIVAALGLGGVLPLQAMLVRAHFGSRSFGTVLGLLGLVYQPFSIAATQLVGQAHDWSGSYRPAFFALMGAVGVAGLLAAAMPRPPDSIAETSPEPSHA